jgi:hypothetical protein
MKQISRPKRWQQAIDLLLNGLSEIQSLKDEYSDWLDNLPENLQSSALYEKLEAIVNGQEIDDLESNISELEGLELPRGFGRD